MDLYSPVTTLAGIGPSRARQLAALDIHTVYDLIAYFPRAYEDRTQLVTINRLEVGVPACFKAMVTKAPRTDLIRKGLSLTRLTAADETGQINIVYFNQPYAAENLHYGSTYVFYGAITGDYRGVQITNPVYEVPESPGVVTRRIMPIYRLTAGISNKLLAKYIHQALTACLPQLPELLPAAVRQKWNLCGAAQAYAAIHEPPSHATLDMARRRLIFEEFFLFNAALQLMRAGRTAVRTEPYLHRELTPFLQALPFQLTNAQSRAVSEIAADLGEAHR